MAPRATSNVKWVVARKRASAVMALQTVIARSRQMLTNLNIRYLPPLPGTGNGVVTVAATDPAMIAMSENSSEAVLRHQRSPIRGDLVTCRAAADLALWCMARVAIIMRVDARWNCLAGARR